MAAQQGSLGAFCLIVPNGTWNLEPLVRAISEHHPSRRIVAVWCGDPHLRPAGLPAGVEWGDLSLDEPTGAGWNRLLVASSARTYEWLRAAAVVSRELEGVGGPVIVLRVGSVGVLGALDNLVGDQPVSLVARVTGPLADDGLAPTPEHLAVRGAWSDAIAVFADGSHDALRWLVRQMADADTVGPGRWFEQIERAGWTAPSRSSVAGVAGWSTPADGWANVGVVDVDALDRDRPWAFSFEGAPARARLSSDVELEQVVTAARSQIEGSAHELRLPGGVPVDDAMRSSVRSALDAWRAERGELPPEPYGPSGSAFMTWLESSEPGDARLGRYWVALGELRGDLASAFPKRKSIDTARYIEWIEDAWPTDGRSVLLRSSSRPAVRTVEGGTDPSGINVLGFVAFDQSLGHVARQIGESLAAASVPHVMLDHDRSMRSARVSGVQLDHAARYATNLIVVTADQFEFVIAEHDRTVLRGRRNIGYWFWELEHVPAWMVAVASGLDEIWVASNFTAGALAHGLPNGPPVRLVPINIPEPKPSGRSRADFAIPVDRFVFLTSFDQLSVPERKNPFGVIEAFSSTFAPSDDGPVLVVKTTNGDRGWVNHERLLLAAAHRPDVIVWDAQLSRADHMAVVAAADCVVSLHRSEGLGMHCAEAMWLSKPVIATRYSGNVDFMDDTNSLLVDFKLVPVCHGEGIYPPEATWADPDLAQAAALMRRVVEDSAHASAIGAAARQRMTAQPTPAELGRLMQAAADLSVAADS